MYKTIHKYLLEITDVQNISLPIGAEILTIQTLKERPCLWALVDPNGIETERITIEMFETGHPVGYDMGTSRKYISTFQLRGGELVCHAFEYTGI